MLAARAGLSIVAGSPALSTFWLFRDCGVRINRWLMAHTMTSLLSWSSYFKRWMLASSLEGLSHFTIDFGWLSFNFICFAIDRRFDAALSILQRSLLNAGKFSLLRRKSIVCKMPFEGVLAWFNMVDRECYTKFSYSEDFSRYVVLLHRVKCHVHPHALSPSIFWHSSFSRLTGSCACHILLYPVPKSHGRTEISDVRGFFRTVSWYLTIDKTPQPAKPLTISISLS